jgi:hypothetical protein
MTMTKHTPGPWAVCKAADRSKSHDIMGNGFHIAEMIPFDGQEDTANARLIASAPDLLAVLRNAVENAEAGIEAANRGDSDCIEIMLAHLEWIRDEARAAIRKAEGVTP